MSAVKKIVKNWIKSARDQVALSRLDLPCDASSLAPVSCVDLREAFSPGCWEVIVSQVTELGISTKVGGVNPGDRRALYQLVRYLRPSSVLESGTHVGASTVHIALALKETRGHFDTVDIVDVNNTTDAPWVYGKSIHSPVEMIERLGCKVTFYTQSALEYLRRCERKYDLIFLDDLHDAPHVYQEIPLALKLLNPNGYILLHDYFPNDAPLWANGHVIHGPYLAVRKFQQAGVPLTVLPLGALPWPTKLGSTVTSLALIGA